jgi:hypothetical protein
MLARTFPIVLRRAGMDHPGVMLVVIGKFSIVGILQKPRHGSLLSAERR